MEISGGLNDINSSNNLVAEKNVSKDRVGVMIYFIR